jgi:DNA invertase Pin-like site-specific DNA recombinase
MRTVAYVRVSSKSQTLRMQRDAITRTAKQRGHAIVEWYSDKTSGVGLRPELDRLRNDVRGGRVGRVYVYRLDRLSRSGILEVFNLVNEFRHAGCKLETVGDGFSLEGPASDVVIAVWAWVAEMERATIRERMATARKAVEAAGGRWGRPRKTDEATRKRIRALAKTRSVRSIAIALKVPKSTVQRVLDEPN